MNYVIAAAILNDVRKNGKKSAFEEKEHEKACRFDFVDNLKKEIDLHIWNEYYIAEGWSLYPLCCSDRRRQNATISADDTREQCLRLNAAVPYYSANWRCIIPIALILFR